MSSPPLKDIRCLILFFWTVLLILNTYFGIDDIKTKKPTNWRVALTWAAVGISTFSWIKAVILFF